MIVLGNVSLVRAQGREQEQQSQVKYLPNMNLNRNQTTMRQLRFGNVTFIWCSDMPRLAWFFIRDNSFERKPLVVQ